MFRIGSVRSSESSIEMQTIHRKNPSLASFRDVDLASLDSASERNFDVYSCETESFSASHLRELQRRCLSLRKGLLKPGFSVSIESLHSRSQEILTPADALNLFLSSQVEQAKNGSFSTREESTGAESVCEHPLQEDYGSRSPPASPGIKERSDLSLHPLPKSEEVLKEKSNRKALKQDLASDGYLFEFETES